MKTTYKIIVFLFLVGGFTSCSDFLDEDPKGRLASKTFFTSKEDLAHSLTALYSVVAGAEYTNNTTGTNFLAGDDISTHPGSNKQPLREYDQYDVSDNNSWMPDMWVNRWKIVKAANFIINNASRTPDVSEEEITVAIAQAHFWRAFAYFYLVQSWGPVPIMLEEKIDYEAQLNTEEEIKEAVKIVKESVSDLRMIMRRR